MGGKNPYLQLQIYGEMDNIIVFKACYLWDNLNEFG